MNLIAITAVILGVCVLLMTFAAGIYAALSEEKQAASTD